MEQEAPNLQAGTGANESPSAVLAGATILAVDDEPEFLQFYDDILSDQGCTVLGVKSLSEAIRRLQGNSGISLILCDLRLGQSKGDDLLEFIGSNLRFSDIPVVMCTGSSKLDDVVRCLKLGARDYIAKPISGEILIAKVTSILASRGGRLILVGVDRHEANLIGRALRADSLTVEPVATRSEALALLEDGTYCLAMLRLTLPDGSGLDLMSEMKERLPNLPVLMILSWENGLDDEKVIAAGADGIIHRPFKNTEIAQQVKVAINRSRRSRPAKLNATRQTGGKDGR